MRVLFSLFHQMNFTAMLLAIVLAAPATAQQIYEWIDESGRKHYSSTPDHPDSKAAKLPDIRRENIDDSIKKLQAETPPSCEKHGGVDCAAGGDEDGSVICLDGSREAKLPYRFHCMEARLKSELTIEAEEKGKFIKHSKELQRKLAGKPVLELFLGVRNLSGVPAFGVKSEIRLPGRGPIPLEGPVKIEAFGQADYHLPPGVLSGLGIRDIEQARYRISCTNCDTSLGVN